MHHGHIFIEKQQTITDLTNVCLVIASSLSSAEFEVSSATARVLGLPTDTSAGYYSSSSRGSVSSSPATRWRSSGIGARSSSQDDPGCLAAEDVIRRSTAAAAAAAPPSSSSSANRNSIYASGTRSAYGSRDPSPDTNGRNLLVGGTGILLRRTSPYPNAPPSMIITPSHTPRRADSVEPDQPMTSDEIARLYERLNAIERETATDLSFAASALGGTAAAAAAADQSRGRTLTKAGGPVAVAPAAATTDTTVKGRSASVSPRTARRQFYEDYSTRTAAGGGDGATSAATGSPDAAGLNGGGVNVDRSARSASVTRAEEKQRQTSSSHHRSKITAAASSLFQTIKDRRKLFGGRKSASIDNSDSVTGTSIARIGAQVLTEPAAPSTYQPPSIPEPSPAAVKDSSAAATSGSKRPGRLSFQRRTISMDVGTVYTTSSTSTAASAAVQGSSSTSKTPATDRQERASSTTKDGINVDLVAVLVHQSCLRGDA